jgi:hypothetical protein
MRELKYGDRSPAERDRVAERLRALKRRSEAILLFESRPDHPFLQEERVHAVKEGNAFHLLSLRRMGVEVSDEDLRSCGRRAESSGRWLAAHQCYEALDDQEGLARVADRIPESLRERDAAKEEDA